MTGCSSRLTGNCGVSVPQARRTSSRQAASCCAALAARARTRRPPRHPPRGRRRRGRTCPRAWPWAAGTNAMRQIRRAFPRDRPATLAWVRARFRASLPCGPAASRRFQRESGCGAMSAGGGVSPVGACAVALTPGPRRAWRKAAAPGSHCGGGGVWSWRAQPKAPAAA